MDAFDYGQYRNWLCRAVTNQQSVVQEAYGTPNPNVFWAIRDVQADVFWGKEPGKFKSKIFCRVEFKRDKIIYIKISWNPLHFLYAVHANVPIFKMALYDERINAAIALNSTVEASVQSVTEIDASATAVAKRIQDNLNSFRCPDYWDAVSTLAHYAPNFNSIVWFLPPEMKESYPPEMKERVETWSALSCPDIDFDEAGQYWKTDDPHIYFCEYMCYGRVDW